MATPFGGHAGEVCQSAGIYRSEYGENSRLIGVTPFWWSI